MWEEYALMALQLVIALGLGALVGLEREIGRKPAGLRTHMLVSMGACLFTIVSVGQFDMDPARVASGIVTGIGFIGAGTIMGSKIRIKGITTAATLWVTAGVGLAVGAGMYVPAIIAAILVFLVLQMWRIELEIGD
ncbi:MAG: MgtC/SapB family protein [Candidatus Aenigmarchaeota archaeon]|nr:MgtC/SapB family protein [Candidatus Aenigmarchaeota archaeon]